MKAGTKLKSAVCDTEVMLIRVGTGIVECGGAPMVAESNGDKGALDPAFAEGTKMGKRYTDAGASFEFLCVKPGAGSLSVDGVACQVKDAKPLPSSD